MTTTHSNLFDDLPDDLPEELSEPLVESERVRIEWIVSRGHASPPGFWYDQERDEWVVVLRGRAGLLFEGDDEATILGPGDHVVIPAHRRHRVEWTGKDDEASIWLAVHFE
jgi:cupin 2 domain-containing protein